MKVTLAIEWSTRRLSVATCDADGFLEESVLEIERFYGPDAVGLLEDHLKRTGIGLGGISEILIGRGPGNFSGIRLAFAWAAGCMAPGGVELGSYSSGRVMAERLRETVPAFWVLGDARRGLWWGTRADENGIGPWELAEPEVWRTRIGAGRVFSSEAERIQRTERVEEAFPSALDLLRTGLDREAREPLYLHPAV